jgi:hypothetical protein
LTDRRASLVVENSVSCRPAVDILGQTVLRDRGGTCCAPCRGVSRNGDGQEEHMGVPELASLDALEQGQSTPGTTGFPPGLAPCVRLRRFGRPCRRAARIGQLPVRHVCG